MSHTVSTSFPSRREVPGLGFSRSPTTGSLDATPPKMFWRAVRNAKSYGAELYLFSDSDPLCDANKVQALLTERRDSGTIHAKVSFKRWKESRHCAHLVDQRDEYVAELRQFLRLK